MLMPRLGMSLLQRDGSEAGAPKPCTLDPAVCREAAAGPAVTAGCCLADAPPCNDSLAPLLPSTAALSCASFRKAEVVVGLLWFGGVILDLRWVSQEVLSVPVSARSC